MEGMIFDSSFFEMDIWQFYLVLQMVKLDSLTVCWQVANIVVKEFAGHPKVYIWNGEGKTQNTTRLHRTLCFFTQNC